MEQWRILDCSTMRGKLCTKRGALSVEREDSPPVLLPVADIAVALIGISVSFSAAVIHQLAKHDVAIVFCDWKEFQSQPLTAGQSMVVSVPAIARKLHCRNLAEKAHGRKSFVRK